MSSTGIPSFLISALMSEYHLSSVAVILSSFKAASRTDSLYEFNLTGIPKAISLNPQTDKIYVANADKKRNRR